MKYIKQKFQVGDQIDYIDLDTRQWVGPAEVVEILWTNFCGFFLYIIDNDEYTSCRAAQELRLHGADEDSHLVSEL